MSFEDVSKKSFAGDGLMPVVNTSDAQHDSVTES